MPALTRRCSPDAPDECWHVYYGDVESARSQSAPACRPAKIPEAVMALPPDERRDRAKVNEAVREGLRLGPLQPAGSEDLYSVL